MSVASSEISACCKRSARVEGAAYCEDCGKPLLHCMASAECGSLLDGNGCCPVCVQPELRLDAGAATSVREGGKLALPLTLSNTSPAARPLFVNALWVREDDGEYREIPLTFKRLDGGGYASLAVRTGVLEHAGQHQVDILIAVSTRYEWREEEYVFSSSIIFPVESKDPSGPQTNINVTAEQVGAGFTIYNPTRVETAETSGTATHLTSVDLKLVRADFLELKLKRRGYEDGTQVPRNVAFSWQGFDQDHIPFEGPILRPSGLLAFGRNARTADVNANDVRLVVSGDDETSRAMTMSVSRQHFSLYTENGRLRLRVSSQSGLMVNNDKFDRGELVTLHDGDVIRPLRKAPGAIAMKVTFERSQDLVPRVQISRISG